MTASIDDERDVAQLQNEQKNEKQKQKQNTELEQR